MELALLVLRLVVGIFFVGHGAQKLFGSFGGHGIAGTAQFFEAVGIRPGRLNAIAAGVAELGGGALLALGLLTPLAGAALISVMTVAIITVHGKNGPWVTDQGYEYNLVLAAVAFALAGVGPGTISLDHAMDAEAAGTGWALLALGVGVLGGLATVLYGRTAGHRLAARKMDEPTAAEQTLAAREARIVRPDPAPAPDADPVAGTPSDEA